MSENITQEKNKEYYGKLNERYGASFKDLSRGRRFYIDSYLKIIKKYVKEGDSLGDIGCGSGIITERIKEMITENIMGLELIQKKIEEAKELRINTKIIEGDAVSMPFKENKFDGLVYFSTLHHLPDLSLALNEAKRVLKPGGYLFLSEPNAYSLSKAARMMLHPKILFKYLKILKEKEQDLNKVDKKILGDREQRSLIPKIVKDNLGKAGFTIVVYKTSTNRFSEGLLGELKLKFLFKLKPIKRFFFYFDNYILRYIPIINRLGSIMIIVAKNNKIKI